MSAELTQDEAETELLQQWCATDRMEHCTEELKQSDVGMNRDGSLVYFHVENRRTRMKRYRKQLVLGFGGFGQHSLIEANQILSGAGSVSTDGISDYIRSRA